MDWIEVQKKRFDEFAAAVGGSINSTCIELPGFIHRISIFEREKNGILYQFVRIERETIKGHWRCFEELAMFYSTDSGCPPWTDLRFYLISNGLSSQEATTFLEVLPSILTMS